MSRDKRDNLFPSLFPNHNDEAKQRDSFYHKAAVQLCDALAKKRKIFRKVNINKWIIEFRNLHIRDDVAKSEIKEVLNWYVKHIGEDFIPEAYSAKSFREKFDAIASAMQKRQDPERENKPSYAPGDEADNFKVETKEWIDDDGVRHGRDSIDYGEPEQDEDED